MDRQQLTAVGDGVYLRRFYCYQFLLLTCFFPEIYTLISAQMSRDQKHISERQSFAAMTRTTTSFAGKML